MQHTWPSVGTPHFVLKADQEAIQGSPIRGLVVALTIEGIAAVAIYGVVLLFRSL